MYEGLTDKLLLLVVSLSWSAPQLEHMPRHSLMPGLLCSSEVGLVWWRARSSLPQALLEPLANLCVVECDACSVPRGFGVAGAATDKEVGHAMHRIF